MLNPKLLTKAKTSCDDKMLFMAIIPMTGPKKKEKEKKKKTERDFSEILSDSKR